MAHLRRHLPLLLIAALVIGVQLLTAATETAFYLNQLTMSAWYALVVIGLCLLMGYAGQISLGHAGFFALGGYGSAFLTTLDLSARVGEWPWRWLQAAGLLCHGRDLYGHDLVYLAPWLAAVASVGLTVAVALAVGLPILRLRGHYLAMGTLGFGVIIYNVAKGTKALGEADGLSGVPAFVLVPGVAISGAFAARVINYYLAWGVVLLGLLLLGNLVHSRMGRALRALHGSPEAAAAMGVDVARAKLGIFVLSAALAAVAGIGMTHYGGSIGPGEASIMKSVRCVAIVAVGGMANLWGTLAMATLLNFLSLRGYFGSYDDAVFGAILILVMLFAPNGLLPRRNPWPAWRAWWRRRGRAGIPAGGAP